MSCILSDKLKEETFIRMYFNPKKENYHYAGLKRAYLDFNRTLPIKDKNITDRQKKIEETISYLNGNLKRLISGDYKNQESFDRAHKKLCEKLIGEWDELSIGQAQKWINMSLKYWLLMGESRIEHIDKNPEFFHIPIDRNVLEKMLGEKDIAWSKMSEYDKYLELQKKHRKKNSGNPPIIDEIKFFNETESV